MITQDKCKITLGQFSQGTINQGKDKVTHCKFNKGKDNVTNGKFNVGRYKYPVKINLCRGKFN